MSEHAADEFTCPLCGADLRGEAIPQEYIDKGYYGSGATHYSRKIGHEVRGVYDGTLFWSCPGLREGMAALRLACGACPCRRVQRRAHMTAPSHTPRIVLAIFAAAGVVVPLLYMAIHLGQSPPG